MAKLNEYDLYIENVFSNETFISGSELSKLIQNKFNLADAYSRKIIERAVGKNIIQSSAPITFGKGQFIYFSNTQKLNKDTLKKFCKTNRPPVFRLLEALDDNNGILSYYEALKITASPLENKSSKIDSLDDIIKDNPLGVII